MAKLSGTPARRADSSGVWACGPPRAARRRDVTPPATASAKAVAGPVVMDTAPVRPKFHASPLARGLA